MAIQPTPTFGAAGTAIAFDLNTTTNFPVPSGVTSGQFILALLYTDSDVDVTTVPSPFVQIPGSPITVAGSRPFKVHAYVKVATGSDSGTYNFVIGNGVLNGRIGQAYRFSGNMSGVGLGPMETPSTATDTATTGATTPVVTVSTAGANRLLIFMSGMSAATGRTSTPPSGFTERGDLNDVYALTAATMAQAAQGSSGNVTCTWSGNGSRAAGLFALAPPQPPEQFFPFC